MNKAFKFAGADTPADRTFVIFEIIRDEDDSRIHDSIKSQLSDLYGQMALITGVLAGVMSG